MDDASLYNSVNILSKRKKVLQDFFQKCESTRPLKGKLLDIGCGDGAVTAYIRDFIIDNPVCIEGCDVSEEMINYAKRNVIDSAIEFFVFNIENELPTKLVEKYDYMISSFVFHWVNDQRKALSNVYALLRPGGELLITFIPKSPHFCTYRQMALAPRWSPYMLDVERFVSPYQDSEDPAMEFRALMVESGLRNVEVTCFYRQHDQKSMESLRSLLQSINPFLKRIPPQHKEEYVDELLQTYLSRTASAYQHGGHAPGGPVYYPYYFLKATATK